MEDELRRYFNGEGYYNWGVRLLRQLGHAASEVSEFERYTKASFAPRDVSRRMESALRVYFEQLAPIRTPQYETLKTVKIAISTKENADTPVEIQQLKERFRMLLKERAMIHATLALIAEQSDRATAAERILGLTTDINRISENLRLYDSKGVVPLIVSDEGESAAQSVIELIRTRQYLKERISRLKGDKYLKNKELTTSKREEYEAELTAKQSQLTTLTQQIEALK